MCTSMSSSVSILECLYVVGTNTILVVKNPLSPVEHRGGEGVATELFEMAVEQFVSGVL